MMRLPALALAALPVLAACQDLAAPGADGPVPPSMADVTTASIPPLGDGSRAYLCSDSTVVRARYEDVAAMGPSGRSLAVLDIDGERVRMIQGVSASGTRYIGGGYQWWTRGLNEAVLAPLGQGETLASAQGVACRSNG